MKFDRRVNPTHHFAGHGQFVRMRRRMTALALAAAVVPVVTACQSSAFDNVVSEQRHVDDFSHIVVSDGITLNLVVDGGVETAVFAIYDRDLLGQIVTEVDGETLVLRAEGPFDLTGPRRIVEVNIPSLDGLSAIGGATVSGSGSADAFSLEADGGSDVDLSGFEVSEAELSVSGGAQVWLAVASRAIGSVTGGASVEFLGEPDTEELTVNGGGQIEKG